MTRGLKSKLKSYIPPQPYHAHHFYEVERAIERSSNKLGSLNQIYILFIFIFFIFWYYKTCLPALHGKTEAAKFLVDNCEYDPDISDSCGATPLMDALRSGHIAIAEYLATHYKVCTHEMLV